MSLGYHGDLTNIKNAKKSEDVSSRMLALEIVARHLFINQLENPLILVLRDQA